jgi:hypothetical protein
MHLKEHIPAGIMGENALHAPQYMKLRSFHVDFYEIWRSECTRAYQTVSCVEFDTLPASPAGERRKTPDVFPGNEEFRTTNTIA